MDQHFATSPGDKTVKPKTTVILSVSIVAIAVATLGWGVYRDRHEIRSPEQAQADYDRVMAESKVAMDDYKAAHEVRDPLSLEKRVANNEWKKWLMVRDNESSRVEKCAQLGMVRAAYLQSQEKDNYVSVLEVAKQYECF
jgi:hypothetical protein